MNYTRVLHAFGSHPHAAVMPVDLAMCLSLSRRQPLNQLRPSPPPKPAHRYWQPTDYLPNTGSLHSPHNSSSWLAGSSAVPLEPRSCFRRDGGGASRKRVVFADAKGLALTAVRLFIPETSSPTTSPLLAKPSLVKLQGLASASSKVPRHKFCLGFPQPMQDLKAFLARLRETCVQLASCHISENSLSGKVCVSHDSVEKAVNVKVTFDSWRSHHDIPCMFLQQQRCWGSDMGVFTFDLRLPQNIDPKERLEFCVSFRPGPGATPHWDDNRGQNYALYVEKGTSDANLGDANQGYPTLTQQRPPSWPPRMQSSTEPQYLPRSLSSRVRAEWKTLCSAK